MSNKGVIDKPRVEQPTDLNPDREEKIEKPKKYVVRYHHSAPIIAGCAIDSLVSVFKKNHNEAGRIVVDAMRGRPQPVISAFKDVADMKTDQANAMLQKHSGHNPFVGSHLFSLLNLRHRICNYRDWDIYPLNPFVMGYRRSRPKALDVIFVPGGA